MPTLENVDVAVLTQFAVLMILRRRSSAESFDRCQASTTAPRTLFLLLLNHSYHSQMIFGLAEVCRRKPPALFKLW